MIDLGIFGIELELENKGGSIGSKLYDEFSNQVDPHIQNFVDAIESIILAHACSGVDVQSREYKEGIEVAVESIINNFL